MTVAFETSLNGGIRIINRSLAQVLCLHWKLVAVESTSGKAASQSGLSWEQSPYMYFSTIAQADKPILMSLGECADGSWV